MIDEAGRARLRELAEHMAASRGLFGSRDVAEILRAIDALDAAEAERDAARVEAKRLREALEKIRLQTVNAWNLAHHGKTRARLLEISTAVRAALVTDETEEPS